MKRLIVSLLVIMPLYGFGQPGVGIHQSNLPFFGVSYEFFEHLRPEVRLGTDRYLDELSYGVVLVYDILDKEPYEFYAGAGLRVVDDYDRDVEIAIPVGFNFYPFSSRNFGFHLEITPLVAAGGYDKLRGSWGIRYRFNKQ